MEFPNEHCRVCGQSKWQLAFGGPVRQGTFGNLRPASVYRCEECETEYLPSVQADLEEYYKSVNYRQDVGESGTVEDYFRTHDEEQLVKMRFLQGIGLRGVPVMDVGCGGGSFLDAISGFAGSTIAIEPAESYHVSLRERGHDTFSSMQAALKRWKGQVKMAVCFSVIEHVEQPVEFLREIRSLLAGDGVLILSTPNQADLLVSQGGDAYRSFFYRSVHMHYFNERSLQYAAKRAGFGGCAVQFHHRFNFANFVGWLREKTPTRNLGQFPLGSSFDEHWRTFLESSGTADYLYARLTAR